MIKQTSNSQRRGPDLNNGLLRREVRKSSTNRSKIRPTFGAILLLALALFLGTGSAQQGKPLLRAQTPSFSRGLSLNQDL